MKKLFIIFLFLFIFNSFFIINLNASNSTGHEEFDLIEIPNYSNAKLLINMSSKTKSNMMNKVKRKAFGWNTYVECKREIVKYQARTIFSRTNLTHETITFNYNMSTGKTVSNSVALSGSLSADVSSKLKLMTIGGNSSVKGSLDTKLEYSETEKINFNVNIHPRTKVSLIVKGTAELTNGAAKYHFLWINFFKGHFEFIDVVTEYYELVEVPV